MLNEGWIYGFTNPHLIFWDICFHISKIHMKPRLTTFSEWFVKEGKGTVFLVEEILHILNIDKFFKNVNRNAVCVIKLFVWSSEFAQHCTNYLLIITGETKYLMVTGLTQKPFSPF